MRKVVISLATFLIVTVAVLFSERYNKTPEPAPPPQQPQTRPAEVDIGAALASIDEGELKSMLLWLCSAELEGRMSGKKGNDAARDFVMKYYASLGFDASVQEFAIQNLNNHKEQGSGKTCNVVASIPGYDPALSGESVVIGAHFDHIGYGPSMSRASGRREIHPGADDNASGTVALLGAAKAISKMRGRNKRRIVFISFSAEEMGLIGSKYYVNNPKYSNTVFMLNMDMVGRLGNKKTIDALGAASSSAVKGVIEGLTGYPFRPKITGGSGGGSDHAPFYQKGIPICFLHTGMHDDYHTPDDTADKIDTKGLTWVSRYAAHIVWEVTNLASKPGFSGEMSKEEEFYDHDWRKK